MSEPSSSFFACYMLSISSDQVAEFYLGCNFLGKMDRERERKRKREREREGRELEGVLRASATV